jgi:putative ATPase
VENGWVTLVAATTENPSFSVISPLLSRSLVLTLRPLEEIDVQTVIERALESPKGFGGRRTVSTEALAALIRLASGDARRALTTLDAAAGVSPESSEITLADIAAASESALVRYDRNGDQHYDVISAFIKSVRGSDVDASLHYLARMISAGEDPRFIARRLVILASEDIGLADPASLSMAVAAADAVQLIGMPEGRLPLAEATIHLALAPKSNAVIRGIDAALRDVSEGRVAPVPTHLRDSHYPGAKSNGHGGGYVYAHDAPGGIAAQSYRDDETPMYFVPSTNGREKELHERLAKIRALLRGE